MKLNSILDGIKIRELVGNLDVEIKSIEYDSRNVEEGSLFICIKGFSFDGNKFINEAIKKGACVIVTEENIISNYYKFKGCTFVKVDDTRKAMSKISSNFYNNPTNKLNLIGVTGTNGKTTITTLLNQILNKMYKSGSIGTIEINNGKDIITSTHTTPESLRLQKHFNDMIDNGCKSCVMEVSSHSLKLDRVEDVDFNIGIFTNLTKDHLDFHKDFLDYKNSKQRLFYKTSDFNIINIDDMYGKEIYEDIKNLKIKVYTYGIYNECDIRAKNIKLNIDSIEFELITPTYKEHIKVNIPGEFTVYNILAIISVCYLLNIPKDDIKSYVNNLENVRGRFEVIKNNINRTIIVDYAHTPDALENILKTATDFKVKNIITVFGCGGDRDKTKRPIMGDIANQYSDKVIITNDNPRSENLIDIINDITKDLNLDKVKIIEDRKEAIKEAIKLSKEEDIIIIAGKGHETYQIIGDIVYDFDDKQVVIDILNELTK